MYNLETLFEEDNKVRLERYYDGRKLRRYLQLLELSEQVCRSSMTNEKAKIVAKGFADHFRRTVVCIAMKPFNPEEIVTDNFNDKVFINNVSMLNKLFDPDFKAE